MEDQLTGKDFCGICGTLLEKDEELLCKKCDPKTDDVFIPVDEFFLFD